MVMNCGVLLHPAIREEFNPSKEEREEEEEEEEEEKEEKMLLN